MLLPRFSRTLTLPIAPPYTCNAPSLAVGPHIAVPSHRSAWPEFGGTKPLWDRAEGERLDFPDLGVAIAMEFTDRNGHTTTFNGTLSDDQATLVWANRLCGPPNALGWARACGRPWWAASPRSAPTYTSLGGDCVGGNLIPGVMADRETCEQLCNAHPRCTGFSHDGVSCIIKDESVHSTGEYGDEPCIVDWLSDGQIWDYWQQDWESRRVRDYRERCALDTPEGGWCAVPQDRRDAPGCDLAGSQGSILHCLRQLRAMWYEESVVAALPRASVTLSSVCCYMNGACRTPGPVTCDGASLCIDGQDGQGCRTHTEDEAEIEIDLGASYAVEYVRYLPVEDTPGLAISPPCAFGIQSGQACCAASCGTCGGSSCGSRPGGSSQCCTGAIGSSGVVCVTPFDTGCIVSTAVRNASKPAGITIEVSDVFPNGHRGTRTTCHASAAQMVPCDGPAPTDWWRMRDWCSRVAPAGGTTIRFALAWKYYTSYCGATRPAGLRLKLKRGGVELGRWVGLEDLETWERPGSYSWDPFYTLAVEIDAVATFGSTVPARPFCPAYHHLSCEPLA